MAADETPWRDIGPFEITYDGGVVGKTVENPKGGTNGGARFKLTVSTVDSHRDTSGENPFDTYVSGTTALVEANLAGMSVNQLASLIPGATLSAGPTHKKLTLSTAVGYSFRDNAAELILKPIIDGVPTTDETQWLTAQLAHPKPTFDVAFDMKTERVYAVVFMIYDDLITGELLTMGKQAT